MEQESYIDHLKDRLERLESRMEAARAQIEAPDARSEMAALETLSRLRIRKAELEARLEDAKAAHAEAWSALHTGLQEDVDALFDGFEAWATRHPATPPRD